MALRWWGQIGRTALQYAAETSQMSDRLSTNLADVHHADWQEGLNVVKTATAVAQQTQDANCVTPVSAPTVSKYMRAQDLAEGSSRTSTGTTSSLTQTVARGQSFGRRPPRAYAHSCATSLPCCTQATTPSTATIHAT